MSDKEEEEKPQYSSISVQISAATARTCNTPVHRIKRLEVSENQVSGRE